MSPGSPLHARALANDELRLNGANAWPGHTSVHVHRHVHHNKHVCREDL